ncbi:phosphotransferase [Micromonospora globbae]|uniref:phosphotransferase n=1 Tax=Micromonospora globbae TaxID=1894969 RepID=UPI0037A1782E
MLANRRTDGTERSPFGLCHGEFHPTSLHVSRTGCHLVGWAQAFTGPALLDLATWFGTRTPANPDRLDQLIRVYISAGGRPAAAASRGGLPAAPLGSGWHRIMGRVVVPDYRRSRLPPTRPTPPRDRLAPAVGSRSVARGAAIFPAPADGQWRRAALPEAPHGCRSATSPADAKFDTLPSRNGSMNRKRPAYDPAPATAG